MVYIMRTCIFGLLITLVGAYPRCNDVYEQHEYFENERRLFDVAHDRSPFDTDYMFTMTQFQPTTCVENDTINRISEGSTPFIMENTQLEQQEPLYRFPLFDSLIWKTTDWLWRLSGWTKIIENGEHYWYYPNDSTDRTVFYLHGVNAVNGFENIVLLRKLARHASVYFSVYSPVLYFDADYGYSHTYSDHIDNVAMFISDHKSTMNDIIGNSYGTIRITTMCKRYPDLCDAMDHIVLTDPLNINLPFSKLLDACLYGIFFNHPDKTPIYHESMTINTLRLERHYMHIYSNMDWYEWSLDSVLMKRFAHNMVLVIGDQDDLIDINRESLALKTSRVIYTHHGMVIFTDFMDQVY